MLIFLILGILLLVAIPIILLIIILLKLEKRFKSIEEELIKINQRTQIEK